MYINFDENRPDTPRVPQTLTRLERILLAVVAYQCLLLSYYMFPSSFFAKPVHELLAPDEQLRFVQITPPPVDRPTVPKKAAPLSDLDRRSAMPQPIPKPPKDDPFSKGNTPEPLTAAQPEPPKAAAPAPPVTGPSPNEAPLTPPRVAGGILGNALRQVQRYAQNQNYDNLDGGGGDQGPDIQFDSKGVDFGAWLRRFREQVYRNWLIPQAAMVMHGHVVIQMSILRNGTIVNPHVVQGSGIEAFDSAAMGALKLSNPTMKLPDAYPGQALDPFTVTFYYNERVR